MWSVVSTLALVVCVLCCSLCHADNGTETIRRNRVSRQASTEYYLDIFVVADYAIYNSWYQRTPSTDTSDTRETKALKNLKRYFTLVLDETNKLYSQVKDGSHFQLNIRPVGFFIETQNLELWTRTSTLTGQVDAAETLVKLRNWAMVQRNLPAYDHILLFTGKDLATDSDGHTSGRGSVGTMCKIPTYNSLSVIEDKGGFQSVFTVAHELGHSLGAQHDGTGNNCHGSDRYIMAGKNGEQTDSNKRHPWFFSDCSKAEIASYIHNLNQAQVNNCLQTAQPQNADVPDVTGIIPGQLYDEDAQCQHLYGQASSYCLLGNLSTICTSMPCKDPTDPLQLKCLNHVAATGTSCGDKKWCQAGACVESSDAPSLSACTRDMATRINGMSCQQMVQTQPALCYDADVYRHCCFSCQSIDSKIPGCPYGDRKRGCSPDICHQIRENGQIIDEECCGTCNFSSNVWSCIDVSMLDGMTCAAAVQKNGVQGCYNRTKAFHCCATCQSKRNVNAAEGCEYGDLVLQGCAYQRDSICDDSTCCDTCRVNTGGSGMANIHPLVLLSVFVFSHVL